MEHRARSSRCAAFASSVVLASLSACGDQEGPSIGEIAATPPTATSSIAPTTSITPTTTVTTTTTTTVPPSTTVRPTTSTTTSTTLPPTTSTSTTTTLPPTTPPPTTPPPPSPPVIDIAIRFDAAGNDNENKNDEWVRFTNRGTSAVDFGGWMVSDEGPHRYRFSNLVLPIGGSVTLFSGCGTDTDVERYWCNPGSAVWNNSGDTVFLSDSDGVLIAQRSG